MTSATESLEVKNQEVCALIDSIRVKLDLLSEYDKEEQSVRIYTYNRRMSLLDDIIKMAKEIQIRG